MPSKRPTSRPSKKPSSSSSSPDRPEEPFDSSRPSPAAVLEIPNPKHDRGDRTRSPKSKKPKPSDSTMEEPDLTSAGDSSRKSHRKRKAREFPDNGEQAVAVAAKVWSDEDEAALLRAAAAFVPRFAGRAFPRLPEMSGFFEFAKGSLSSHSQLTLDQVYNKLRRLKGKFLKSPNSAVGSAPHDLLVYELSLEIWGAEGKKPAEEPDEKVNAATADGEAEEEDKDAAGDVEDYPLLSEVAAKYWRTHPSYLHGVPLLKGMKMVDPAKAKILEERWRKHCEGEIVMQVRKATLAKQLLELLVPGRKKGSAL